MSGQKPREIAVRILQERSAGEFVEGLLENAAVKLSPADRRLCQELVFGVVRWQRTLDWLIARKTADRPQKPLLRDLLRLGLYQLFWLDRVPAHAAVHETVDLARRNGLAAQTGFLNAVLRGYARDTEATRTRLADLKIVDPALGYSHPEWLVQRWRERLSSENLGRLLEWNNTPPKTFARLNTLKTNSEDLQKRWRAEQVDFSPVSHDWFPADLMFALHSHPPLSDLPSFRQGWFYIQDPSTLLAVSELEPQPGETVLDLCSAPGGKLTHIAQVMQNRGLVLAHDTSPQRRKRITENCARLGVGCVRILSPRELRPGGPADKLPEPGRCDRILIDAPCSNTGVLRRRVDLRWRIRPEEIGRLSRMQLELLRQAAPWLKPAGRLVYSTCSLEPEENEAVLDEFLSHESAFALIARRQLLPFANQTDGAFVARLERR